MSTLDPLGGLAADLDLAAKQQAARLAGIQTPAAMVAAFHGIDYLPGDNVSDTVTGSPAVVLGSGVAEVQTEE